ncbi:ATP-binding protein, partial [Paracoccaceae bacterium]|nr:ATP-binding protein [Paracoccaceae bacterium]
QLLYEFGQFYLGFSIVLVLSAIWFALWIAERLTRPVSSLVAAVEKVGKGDLTVEVSEEKGKDEIAILGKVFNKMIRQIKKQRDSLLSINSKTEEKKRQFEAVLDGASGGIIGTDSEGNIEVINVAAESILGLHENEGLLKELKEIAPEFQPLFNKATFLESGSVEDEVEITRENIKEKIFLKISIIKSEKGQVEGYVLTFDDLTDLVAAQRSAAWGDVARRVAHEVKNPLTPIKLAAERLKKTFFKLNNKDKTSAEEYANMIIRQTESLSRLVTEFSDFSRLPVPNKVELNICKLTESAILLQKVAFKHIIFKFKSSDEDIFVLGDGQLLNQALLNLMKNSIEAISSAKQAKLLDEKGVFGQIDVNIKTQNNEVCISILDNGIGLPKNINRLFEPYVTIKKEGTGLGLSIVKKIIEDHLGSLILVPGQKFKGCNHFGAEANIILPVIGDENLKDRSLLYKGSSK